MTEGRTPTPMFDHHLRFEHDRSLIGGDFATPEARSTVDITASSTDLVEAWHELLSRMPNDLYAGLKAAMGKVER